MAIHKFQIFEYAQNDTTFISLILPLGVLVNISKVLVYGQDIDGYQRQPNSAHYNKIKKYVLTQNPEDYLIPTSIILGGDEAEITDKISEENGCKFLTIDDSIVQYRVVDGQHRIYGLSEASKTNPNVGNFPLNVIIVLTTVRNRSKELQIFTDINSKSKRINTDLALLAKFDYQIKENIIALADINQHIAVKSAYGLKEAKGNNVWQNAIKFDIHSEVTIGIIGISIFAESIKSIIDKYIDENSYIVDGKELAGEDLINYCKNASSKVSEFLLIIWNEIIKVKWQGAFKEDFIKNDEGELVKIFYNKEFYIQKGLGIKSLNPVVGDIVKDIGFNDEAIAKVRETIFASKIKIDDWKNGGPFSGFNSESGFSKIKQAITNKIALPGTANPNQIGLF
jgi:DGQHR domain-containing protein